MNRHVLQYPPGSFYDDGPFNAAGRWWQLNNVRNWRGTIETIGGWSELPSGDGEDEPIALAGVPRGLHGWYDNDERQNLAIGTDSGCYVYRYDPTDDSQDFAGIGLTGSVPNTVGQMWRFENYGETLLCSHFDPSRPVGDVARKASSLYQWSNNIANDYAKVTNSPTDMADFCVTAERQVLAAGTNEESSGEWNPRCIRGSEIEDITDWTTGVASNAFEHILEADGEIRAIRRVGPYVVVWTSKEMFLGQFIGAAEQTYKFDRIAGNCGIAYKGSLTVIGQSAYWLGYDLQFRRWTLGSEPQILSSTYHQYLEEMLPLNPLSGAGARSFAIIQAVPVTRHNEVWWFFEAPVSAWLPNRYVAYNFADDLWHSGTLSRSCGIDSGVFPYPLMAQTAATSAKIYEHEKGDDADGSALAWAATSGAFYDPEGYKLIQLQNFWPGFAQQSQGGIKLEIFGTDYPDVAWAEKGSDITIADATAKADFLHQNRFFYFRLSNNGDSGFMRMGHSSFGFVLTGDQ